ncbi:hypothetical protein ILUMI_15732 [Ignelater luminosus]|uniref:Uncharacterized protein n=1 Tax=Ignelater luminosus TaxID=2038154 RepID=A0A8K0CSH3_IGNLU|nr:hypothetical protein ILUMI_15732 [Ignelater luminosus]
MQRISSWMKPKHLRLAPKETEAIMLKWRKNQVYKLTIALNRLMPHHGGPKASRKRVLVSVAHSAILYGAPVWSQVLHIQLYRNKLLKVHRQLAIRVSGAYHTISADAVMVLARIIPID